jgi:hypothetical protein
MKKYGSLFNILLPCVLLSLNLSQPLAVESAPVATDVVLNSSADQAQLLFDQGLKARE